VIQFRSSLLRYLLFAAVALVAFVAGVMMRTQPAEAPQLTGADALLATRLLDLHDQPQRLDQWRGKVLVVNFWATWCAPCREEIPIFVAMQDQYRDKGLQFVGIAIDQVDKTREFATSFKINYPTLMGGFDTVELSQQVGNSKRGLPFTVVLDRHGKIASTELGGITREKLEALINPLL